MDVVAILLHQHTNTLENLQYRCLRNKRASMPCGFIGFGAVDVTKPYKFIGFGAMEGITSHVLDRYVRLVPPPASGRVRGRFWANLDPKCDRSETTTAFSLFFVVVFFCFYPRPKPAMVTSANFGFSGQVRKDIGF